MKRKVDFVLCFCCREEGHVKRSCPFQYSTCGVCGRQGHVDRACWRRNKQCYLCKEYGHLIKCCPEHKRKNIEKDELRWFDEHDWNVEEEDEVMMVVGNNSVDNNASDVLEAFADQVSEVVKRTEMEKEVEWSDFLDEVIRKSISTFETVVLEAGSPLLNERIQFTLSRLPEMLCKNFRPRLSRLCSIDNHFLGVYAAAYLKL